MEHTELRTDLFWFSAVTVFWTWRPMPLIDSALRSMHRSLSFCTQRANTLWRNYASAGHHIPSKATANSMSKQFVWKNPTVIFFRVCLILVLF